MPSGKCTHARPEVVLRAEELGRRASSSGRARRGARRSSSIDALLVARDDGSSSRVPFTGDLTGRSSLRMPAGELAIAGAAPSRFAKIAAMRAIAPCSVRPRLGRGGVAAGRGRRRGRAARRRTPAPLSATERRRPATPGSPRSAPGRARPTPCTGPGARPRRPERASRARRRVPDAHRRAGGRRRSAR